MLLHPTSLPGRYGIGDLGTEAYRFAHFLAESGVRLWQVLPLGPTGYGDSPYQSFSAFAGNPLLISPEMLVEEGLLSQSDLDPPPFPESTTDYARVLAFKLPLLKTAFRSFQTAAGTSGWREFQDFCQSQQWWLEDYALFRAVKEQFEEQSWTTWDDALVHRDPATLEQCRQRLSEQIEFHRFQQFEFFKQWRLLKRYCKDLGLLIMGDMPLFVAHDSADVWANQDLFHLDSACNPSYVAGVPPDYFSATGQLWGNPVYRWKVMAANSFSWWVRRMRSTIEMVDLVRLDHFRGFEAFWRVPGGAETAMNGEWKKAPGAALLEKLGEALGTLPLIAENLGWITPEVEALRTRYDLPGMAILQFAFGTDPQASTFIPHNLAPDTVIYTGTHDNDTLVGWWKSTPESDSTRGQEEIDNERDLARRYLDIQAEEPHWDFIRAAMSSVARIAIIPAQDILGLDNSARMNLPGEPSGNWRWRLKRHQLTAEHQDRLRELSWLYGRLHVALPPTESNQDPIIEA